MSLLSKLFGKARPSPPPIPSVVAEDKRRVEEAQLAKRRAHNLLFEVKARQPEIDKVVTDLRQMREANHFSDMLRDSLRRKPR